MNKILHAVIVGTALLTISLQGFAQTPNAPFAGAAKMTCAEALKEAGKSGGSLAPLAKNFDADAAKLKKSPKDAKVKKAYVDSAMKYEQAIYIGSNKLSPSIKYRSALALCRLVLAVDPKNAQAKKDQDETVAIYKQMGRPVPN